MKPGLWVARHGSIAPHAPAGTPTTYTIFGGTADGYVNAVIPGAADAGGVDAVTNSDIYIGQQVGTAYEGFLVFDTSAVAGTITAVTLSLWGMNDSSVTDFTLEARAYDWGATLTAADWRSAATLATLPLAASRSTVGWSTSGYNVLTSEAAFLSNINQAGSTRLVLCSSRFVAGTSPSGNEFVGIRSADQASTTNDPKLVIEALV